MWLAWLLCLALDLTPGHVRRVIDGDTFTLYAPVVSIEERARVLGVDAPERGTPGFEEARQFAVEWLAKGNFRFDACKRDSFGRYLAWVTRGTDSLHVALINAGHGARAE